MKRCLPALAALALLSPALSTSAEELTARELKKLQKQAQKAYEGGQTAQATEIYERILDSMSADDSRRGDALYAIAFAYLSPLGPDRDVAKARGLLEQLDEFPRHPRNLEISAARTLLAELDAGRAELERRDAELKEQAAAFEAAREQAQEQAQAQREEAAGESEAAGGRVKSLQAQLRKMRAELAETRTELEKKEDALRKLKDALVGRASGTK